MRRVTGNSLAPGRRFRFFKSLIFKLFIQNSVLSSRYEIALRWMSKYLTDDLSTFVPAMDWCRQAASHYLNQCWSRSLSPYGITMPQWVKCLSQMASNTEYISMIWLYYDRVVTILDYVYSTCCHSVHYFIFTGLDALSGNIYVNTLVALGAQSIGLCLTQPLLKSPLGRTGTIFVASVINTVLLTCTICFEDGG